MWHRFCYAVNLVSLLVLHIATSGLNLYLLKFIHYFIFLIYPYHTDFLTVLEHLSQRRPPQERLYAWALHPPFDVSNRRFCAPDWNTGRRPMYLPLFEVAHYHLVILPHFYSLTVALPIEPLTSVPPFSHFSPIFQLSLLVTQICRTLIKPLLLLWAHFKEISTRQLHFFKFGVESMLKFIFNGNHFPRLLAGGYYLFITHFVALLHLKPVILG